MNSALSEPVWQTSHSVETGASPAFAWSYWTNVSNWDDPPAKFELAGPFAADTHGVTRFPDQEPRHWRIREVHPGKSFVLEMDLEGATLTFQWSFDPLPEAHTRLTQRITLQGDNAAVFVSQLDAAFTPNLPPGMSKIAASMARAEAEQRSFTNDARR
jgi:hypothetical protein